MHSEMVKVIKGQEQEEGELLHINISSTQLMIIKKHPKRGLICPPRQLPHQQRHALQVTVKRTQPNIHVIEQDPIWGKPFENIKAHYTLRRELGRGQYGVIYLCAENSTGQHYSCKSTSKRKLVCKKDMEVIKREIQIMQHLSGQPNIVEFKGAYEDKYSVHLVMELCVGGELFDKIIAKRYYSEKNATGFGLSIFIEEGKVYCNIGVSSYYVAPKVLRHNYGKEVDVWSAGVILYILLSGVLPYWDETVKGKFHAILKGDIDFQSDPWTSIPDSSMNLVRKMLTQDVKTRITSAEVLDIRRPEV